MRPAHRRRAAGPSARRRWLWGSIAFNLLLLGIFKYFDFFAESLAALLGAAGMKADLPTLRLILPAGISFYTFQSMSYVIDVYRGQIPATAPPEDFALFVTYFPQLVAGPIERAANLIPRLLAPRRVTSGMLAAGALLVFVGMVKKVALADRAAVYVDKVAAPEAARRRSCGARPSCSPCRSTATSPATATSRGG